MELAKINDLNIICSIDTKFYNDNFFNKSDIKNIINGKSKNKVYISKNKKAYLMIFKMPNNRCKPIKNDLLKDHKILNNCSDNNQLYITSLAGAKSARRELLTELLKMTSDDIALQRIYTHAKESWGTDLLREFGFKKKGRGNIKDELVKFNDDISKLWLYELNL